MKYLVILFLVGVAFCNPKNSEEHLIQQDRNSRRSDFDSLESHEVAFAGDEEFIGPEAESSNFESYEVPLLGTASDIWRKDALAEVNKMRMKYKLRALTMKTNNNKQNNKAQMMASAYCKGQIPSANKDTSVVNRADVRVASTINNSTMAKMGVNEWYNEYKQNDCRPIYESKIKDSKSESRKQYKKVKNYLNLMSRRYEWVEFGLATNCLVRGTRILVARFGGDAERIMAIKYGELASQGLGRSKINDLDISKQAPCPVSCYV